MAPIATARRTASHQGKGYAKCMISPRPRRPPTKGTKSRNPRNRPAVFSCVSSFRVFRDREWSWFFLGRNRLEIAVDLFLVAGGRRVVCAGSEAILGLLRLQLLL